MSGRPRLELISLSRSFGAVRAVQRVSIRVFPGEICAVLGENGAGKSSLMNLLYGVLQPDAGAILWKGREVHIADPGEARSLGIGMVFQHFSVLETLTVGENIAITFPGMSNVELAARFESIRGRYGLRLELEQRVAELSVGERQRLEIIRCLMQDMELLILDEPTSVLAPSEVEQLFTLLAQLAKDGCSVLFISHKLPEVFSLCSRAVVLRRGEVSGSVELDAVSEAEVTRLMLGRDAVAADKTAQTSRNREASGPGLEIADLSLSPGGFPGPPLEGVELAARPGEIIGIAGVAGSGQDCLMAALAGEITTRPDALLWKGEPMGALGPRERRRRGWRTLPVNRLGHAACPGLGLVSNLLLTHYDAAEFRRRWWLDWQAVETATERLLVESDVRVKGSEVSAFTLSGGNLQKFLVARELLDTPQLLACYNPTWGVDAGAREVIHKALRDAAAAGTLVILLSEDIDELLTLGSRIGALYQGRLSPLAAVDSVTIEDLGRWMTGQGVADAA